MQASLSLRWSQILHCGKSHVVTQMYTLLCKTYNFIDQLRLTISKCYHYISFSTSELHGSFPYTRRLEW